MEVVDVAGGMIGGVAEAAEGAAARSAIGIVADDRIYRRDIQM